MTDQWSADAVGWATCADRGRVTAWCPNCYMPTVLRRGHGPCRWCPAAERPQREPNRTERTTA